MKFKMVLLVIFLGVCAPLYVYSQGTPQVIEGSSKSETAPEKSSNALEDEEYVIGVEDVLDISVLQPEKIATTATVAPDGTIQFPYINKVYVKGLTINQIKNTIEQKLSEGYMKYPVVVVSLKENRSKRFFVYGEVNKPGPYPVEAGTTVLKAISIAGGFTKYGSASRVKILRLKKNGSGYETIKVNIAAVMNGNSKADVIIQSEDIVIISEGIL